MSTYRLDKLFSPRSVAVVGASPRPTSPGRAVLRNLKEAGFAGTISVVNPRYNEIEGIRSVRSFEELPEAPDLVVIAAPAAAVPSIVAAAGEKGSASCNHHHGGIGSRRRLARRRLREGRTPERPAACRPQLPRRDGAACQSQCKLRRTRAAARATSR